MKSKKVLAQLAALSLLFGAVGAGTAWAEEEHDVSLSGATINAGEKLVAQDSTDKTKYTMSGQTVQGLYMDSKASLTATNVTFVDGEEDRCEVAVDGGSTLILNGGSVKVQDPINSFRADGGSEITTNGTAITSGVFANNSTVTLKNSTTSGFALYAGNEWSEGKQGQTVATGLGVGTLTIDGGTASAKNVLVQNKGTITVTNGAVLDVTGDTTDNDSDTIAATDLKKGGAITVRAWGPNTNYAEKSNNEAINELSKATEFNVEKATVKANEISVAGNKYVPEETQSGTDTSEYINFAKFTATDSTVEAKTISLGKYGAADFKNTKVKADAITLEGGVPSVSVGGSELKYQLNVENSVINAGTLSYKNSSTDASAACEIINSTVTADSLIAEGNGYWDFDEGGSATIGKVTVGEGGYVWFQDMEANLGTIEVAEGGEMEVRKGMTFHADSADVKGQLCFFDSAKATVGEVTAVGTETYSDSIISNPAILISDDKNHPERGTPDVTISTLVLKDQATAKVAGGKLTANNITVAEGTTIEISDTGTLSTKSGQVYTNAASETEKDSGKVKSEAFKFTGGTLELTDAKYTLDYAKKAKAALAVKTTGSTTELKMTGTAVGEDGKELDKVSIDDASLIGNLENVTVSSDKNVLIGTKAELENSTIDEVTVEKQVADSLGAKNLELADAEKGNVGVVITNDKKLTLGGSEGGSVITVVNGDGAEVDKNVKVIVGTTEAVATGLAKAGTFTIGSAADKKYTLKGDVVVNADSALNINGTTEITESVTLAGGSAAVSEGAKLTTKALAVTATSALTGAAKAETVEVTDENVLSVGNADKAGELVVDTLSGKGTVFLDPTWKDGDEITGASGLAVTKVNEKISNALIAGHNSKISFGTADLSEAETVFAKTGETWGDKGILAAVYVAKNVTLGDGSLVADGTKTEVGEAAAQGSVTFGKNSILMVNGAAVTESAAIAGVTKSEVADTSKLYIDGAEKGQTYKILEGAKSTSAIKGWEDKNIITDNALLKFIGEVSPEVTAQTEAVAVVGDENDGDESATDEAAKAYYNVTANVKTMKEAYGDQIITPNVYDEALKGDGKVSDFAMKAAKFSVNGTTAAQVSALNSASAMTELAGTAHGTYAVNNLFTDAVVDHMTLANERTHDKDVWAKYIHSEEDIGGLGLAGMGAGYDAQYNGIVVGADLYKGAKSTVGLALSYADGNLSGNTLAAHTKNDAKYYGASVYGGIENGDSALLGDITYLHGKNDITQWNSTETITGSVKTDAFSIGIRGEQKIKAGEGQLVPYIGLRYMHLSNGSYTNSLGMAYDGDDQNLWLLPVGVKYSVDFKSKNWTVRPVAEVGYVWNMGDRDGRETVRLGNAHDSFGYDVTDSGSYIARLAVEAEKDNTTFGIGYEYQKGDTVKANRWTASVNYRF